MMKRKLLNGCRTALGLLLVLFVLAAGAIPVSAETTENRWESAADAIDKFADAAFEAYLAGDASAAYQAVNSAYFKIYEITGFERQTLTYISSPRKNAVELQFSACKAAVKNDPADAEVQKEVRTELNKLKQMIREDANKLAAKDQEPTSVTKYFLKGEPVNEDPYQQYALDPTQQKKQYKDWNEAYLAMRELLNTSLTAYKGYDFDAAVDNVNTAFYSVYEESGFSHAIFENLPLEEREKADAAFLEAKASAADGRNLYRWKAYQLTLKKLHRVLSGAASQMDVKAAEAKAEAEAAAAAKAQAETADQPKDNGALVFSGSLGIIVREGLEAILVIAAIIAYLVKSGNGKSVKSVYIGALLGIVASFLAAFALNALKQAWVGAGQSQEVIEGITALLAVCVLFYVSNWMISKAEAAAWSHYIDSKVQTSVERRSAFALAFTAFLSVFREGAEVVLFYQPMLSEGNPGMVWAGFGVGCAILVVVYVLIRFLSLKLPVKLFFSVTSILMAVMCVSFLGSGIKELAEGNVFDISLRVPGIPESDALQVLGIYPYLETLVPQLILAIILLITFMSATCKGRLEKLRQELTASK